jgi:hypothetical protein
MKPRNLRLTSAALCLFFWVLGVSAQTLQITDAQGHTTSLTPEQLAKMPHVTVNTKDHDTPAQFEGVPMATVLSSAGITMGDTLRGPRLTEALLVSAADGYQVVFALAEFDTAFATREIILADKRDGKPLAGKEGPFRIVAPGDKRPARWIRQVAAMKVVAVK